MIRGETGSQCNIACSKIRESFREQLLPDSVIMKSIVPRPDVIDHPTIDSAAGIYRERLHGTLDPDIVRNVVREVNRSHGTDVATALLYLHFYDRLGENMECHHQCESKPWMIAIVPGAFYKEHPEIGGDGREIESLALTNRWRCKTIATDSLGTLKSNSDTIIRFLDDHCNNHQILLASLSKGTTDVIAAASREPTVAEKLSGLISISGVPHGTMMADWLLDRWRLRPVTRLMCWKHGADKQAVHDLRHCRNSAFDLFRKIPCFHIAGFPLKRHLSNWRSRLWHRRFCPIGPNDSVVLLEDLLDVPGIILPIWGADHYLKSQWNIPNLFECIVAQLPQGNSLQEPRG